MPSLPVDSHGSGEPFVWLHGFTQTRRSAQNYLTIVAGRHEIVTPDLPGHGEASEVVANLDRAGQLVIDALPTTPCFLGGYSMGARIALHAALIEPRAIKALVLLGATRGMSSPNDRALRQRDDEARAARIDEIGVDAFLDEWLAGPLFTALPDDPVDRAARSTNAQGLASSLRNCGTGTQRFLTDELSRLTMPVLLMAGANDEKFAGEAFEMALHFPDAHVAIIPDAGHAAHLEQPEFVANVVCEFLANY